MKNRAASGVTDGAEISIRSLLLNMGIIEKIFGTHSENELKRIYPIVDRIEALEPEMKALSDEELGIAGGGSGAAECRPCNVRRILDYKKQPVTVWTADDLGGDMARYGLSGSPTQVVDSRTIVAQHKDTEWIAADEESLSDFIARLVESHIVE